MAILKDLIVHGSSRFLNKIYASEIQTPLIEAEAGIIKKLKADDATVVGLLDVQGQMHTNSWTNSNIATIDGSFYITPTLSSSSGTVSFSSATVATFTGTYSAVSSLYIGNNTASTVQWTSGSKILITGQVQVDGEWIPLGTLLGTLNSNNPNPTTSMPVVSITDNRNNTSNILTDIYSLKGNASLSYRNLKVSLYQRADSSTYYPLGIFMTALGQNGKTFLDIYGGVNELTTSYGGYANPNVRIGNLSGLPAITTAAGNFTPVGWGIYTTNGYFSGTIVSNTGVIGGWKLGANSLYNETAGLNDNTVGIYLGTDGIRNYLTSTQYVNITGGKITAQGVDLTGEITATSGTIGGCTISNGVLTVGNANINDINASKINAGDIAAARIQTNLISAINAKVSDLSALTATIGGFQIDSSSIHTNNVAITSNADNSIALSSADFTRTINNTSRTGLRFAIGDKFGVTGDGTIYASNVDLTGTIIATDGTIGGINIVNGALDVSSINIGDLSGEIGGRNLIINTLNPDATAANRPKIFGQTVDTGGRGTASVAEHGIRFTTTSDAYCYIYMGLTSITSGSGATLQGLTPGKTYTFSCDFSCKLFSADTSTTIRHLRFTLYDDTSGSFAVDGEHQNMIDLDASKKGVEQSGNFSYTFTLPANITKLGFVIRSNVTTNTLFLTGDFIELRNIKLEEGNKATKWSPAYEDITVTSYITKIDDTGIKITPYDKSGNNYLQINSDAISMYRNNIKTLEIGDSDIKFYDGQIEGLEIASFGGANGVRIGNEKETHFVINNSAVKTLNNNGSTIFSIETTDTQIGNTIKIASGGIVPSEGYSITLDTNSFSLSTGDEIYIEQITLNLKVTGSFSQTLSFQNFQVNQNPQTITLLGKTSQGPPHPSTTGRFLSYLSTSSNVFKYGTASTISYNLSGNLVNDYSDDHPYSGQIKITYNGNNTFTFNSIIDSSSFNDSGFALEPDSQYSYSDIMVKNKTSYAPALTFGTRLGTVGPLSTVIGEALYAPGRDQMTIGKFNYGEDTQVSPYSFVVGNGRDDIYRSNAFTIDQNGNVGIQGKIHNIIISEGTETKLPLFHFEGKTWTIDSIRANGAWYCEDNNPDINVAGYTPVAIAGYSVWGGTNGSWCVVPRVYIDQHGTDTWGNPTPAKLQGYVWNQGSQEATNIKFTVEILYIANNFID